MNQLTHASPASDVSPCDDDFQGRLLMDFCRDCHHAVACHRQDLVCSVCDALAGIDAIVVELYREVQLLKEKADPDATS